MNNPVVLIGEGPNRVEIPCLIFESFEQGIEYVNKVLDGLGLTARDRIIDKGPLEGSRIVSWDVEFDDADDSVVNSFFKFYYGGCGDCYRLTLKEVSFATPFVGWDLD